jgi:AraC-like DNA-binding protein/quercetin dioxygenase-like cupin family protein
VGSTVRAGVIWHGEEETRYGVVAWLREGLLLEKYRYAPGPAEELPKHSHDEYQICLSLNFPGVYGYRGATHAVPVGSLSVVHPGEVHSARDPQERLAPSSFRMMYAEPALLSRAAAEVAGRREAQPFFRDPIVLDKSLALDFLRLHVALEGATPRLEQDARLLSTLTQLVERHAGVRPAPPPGRECLAVGLAREYLEDNLGRSVPLEELASLANLSPYHLARVFRDEIGMPPHAYQTQARLGRARSLLLRGWPPARVAQETGFADQSHLTRRFKRLVGVTPGRYARRSKNVQYAGAR